MRARLSSLNKPSPPKEVIEIAYKNEEVQVNPESACFSPSEIKECEKDPIVSWDDPSLKIPLCSWSSFPREPSNTLKLLVDLFTPPDDRD